MCAQCGQPTRQCTLCSGDHIRHVSISVLSAARARARPSEARPCGEADPSTYSSHARGRPRTARVRRSRLSELDGQIQKAAQGSKCSIRTQGGNLFPSYFRACSSQSRSRSASSGKSLPALRDPSHRSPNARIRAPYRIVNNTTTHPSQTINAAKVLVQPTPIACCVRSRSRQLSGLGRCRPCKCCTYDHRQDKGRCAGSDRVPAGTAKGGSTRRSDPAAPTRAKSQVLLRTC